MIKAIHAQRLNGFWFVVGLIGFQFIFCEASMAWDPKGFKKPEKKELKEKLSPLEFQVTQEEGTERPFENAYWDNHREGLYVDRISGEPLFFSFDKFNSGTGWPSFTKPVDNQFISKREDNSFFLGNRTEVRSKHGDSHLGHVFEDGPAPTGLRYCINSASLRFVSVDDLEKEGYSEYIPFFKEKKTEEKK